MRFLVDVNVGKLAKLLRMLGYDAVIFRGNDDEMISKAISEDRTILTRDQGFLRRSPLRPKVLLIGSEDPDEQLKEVFFRFCLSTSAAFTRCLNCNSILEDCKKEEIRELVPPYVYQTQNEFKRCPSCGRVFWKGTHWRRMVQRMGGLKKG